MEHRKRMPEDEVTFLDQEAQDFIAATGQSLAAYENVDAALNYALDALMNYLGAEEGSIFLVDESSGDLVLTYAAGEVGAGIVGLRLGPGQGVVGWVVKFSEDLIVPFPGLDARFFEGVDERTGFVTRSIVCGPVRAEEKTVGAIEIMNKTRGTFNDDDIVVLRAIARLAAGVLTTTGKKG